MYVVGIYFFRVRKTRHSWSMGMNSSSSSSFPVDSEIKNCCSSTNYGYLSPLSRMSTKKQWICWWFLSVALTYSMLDFLDSYRLNRNLAHFWLDTIFLMHILSLLCSNANALYFAAILFIFVCFHSCVVMILMDNCPKNNTYAI